MSGLFSLESWSTVWTHRESFLLGLGNTLQTAVCALALAFIIGTNLGGLGTLIASIASLISYRQIARELPQGKKQYFGLFTLSNLIFLAILLGVWFLLR